MKKLLTLVLGLGLFSAGFSLKTAAKEVKTTKFEQSGNVNKKEKYGFQLDYCFKNAGMEKNFGKQENPAKKDYENFKLAEMPNKTNVNHALALYVMLKKTLRESLNEDVKKDLEFKLQNLVLFNFVIFKNLGVLGTTSWLGICSKKELLEYEKILKLENLKKVKIDKNKLDEAKKEIVLILNEAIKTYEEGEDAVEYDANEAKYFIENYKNKIRNIKNAKLKDVKKAAEDMKLCRLRIEKPSVGDEFSYFA